VLSAALRGAHAVCHPRIAKIPYVIAACGYICPRGARPRPLGRCAQAPAIFEALLESPATPRLQRMNPTR
jgi:hypothetical protein